MKPNRIKLSTLNGIERGATSRHRPHLVFARDDGAGSQKRPAEPPRVLIVEDDFLVAEQMQIALTEAGFEIAGVATSGDEAIKLAIAQSPTLALMDIRLVGHRDGVDTALELFRDHGIRCIFATAYHDPNTRRRAKPANPLGWLAKPYTMEALVEMVRGGLKSIEEE